MPRRRVPRSAVATVVAVLAASSVACDQYAVAADPDASATPTPALTPIATAAVEDPCAIGPVGPGGAAEPIRDPTGACPGAEHALLVRCAPDVPPAIVLDAGTSPRVFLGGAYAVAAAGRPAGLVEVGTTTAGRLWRSATDPRRLYVESSGTWWRWLLLAEPGDLSPTPTVAMIGDSILDGSREAVIEALPGWEVTVDAEVGRSSDTAAAIVEALPPPVPDVVVVQIGTNDHDPAAFAERADAMLTALRGADLVVWVNTRAPDPTSDAVNRAIETAARSTPQTATADWASFVTAEELSSDGVHPALGNEHLLADLLAPMLDRWAGSVRGGVLDCLEG
jgi:hypothetical protein